jgi:hypothetical protein
MLQRHCPYFATTNHRLLIIALPLLMSVGNCAGQITRSNPGEPPLVGVFFYLDQATQELKALPAEHSKTTVEGLRRNFIEVSGTHSPFRIATNDKTEFIFKIEHPEYARLFKFTAKKDYRHFEFMKSTFRTKDPDASINVNITKFGESSYKLIPQTPLERGEYGLLISSWREYVPTIFTFSVGASGN